MLRAHKTCFFAWAFACLRPGGTLQQQIVFQSVGTVLLRGQDIDPSAAQSFRYRQRNVHVHVETDRHVRSPAQGSGNAPWR